MSPTGASALPDVNRAAMPPEVRNGTPEQQHAYRAALGFERMLVRQLIQQMTDATKAMTGEDGDSEAAATATYKDLYADALADNVARGGGLGLARDLYTSLQGTLK
jgi:Rod binding domain-containing protein